MNPRERCAKHIWDGFGSHQCRNTAIAGGYCGVHDPMRRNTKQAAMRAWREKESALHAACIRANSAVVASEAKILALVAEHHFTLPDAIESAHFTRLDLTDTAKLAQIAYRAHENLKPK